MVYDLIHSERPKLPKKPVIIAICGKSATGKDTLANWLLSMLKTYKIPCNIIISDTTRPPRIFEENNIDYNFLTDVEFHNKINNEEYLEYTSFNGWFYGTDIKAILKDSINIGVFNLEGMSNLANHQDKFEIICVYLKCNFIQRLLRSYERERKFKVEYVRRAHADYCDFKDIKSLLKRFPNQFIFDSHHTPTVSMVDHIIWRLKMKNLLPSYNKSQ